MTLASTAAFVLSLTEDDDRPAYKAPQAVAPVDDEIPPLDEELAQNLLDAVAGFGQKGVKGSRLLEEVGGIGRARIEWALEVLVEHGRLTRTVPHGENALSVAYIYRLPKSKVCAAIVEGKPCKQHKRR